MKGFAEHLSGRPSFDRPQGGKSVGRFDMNQCISFEKPRFLEDRPMESEGSGIFANFYPGNEPPLQGAAIFALQKKRISEP